MTANYVSSPEQVARMESEVAANNARRGTYTIRESNPKKLDQMLKTYLKGLENDQETEYEIIEVIQSVTVDFFMQRRVATGD